MKIYVAMIFKEVCSEHTWHYEPIIVYVGTDFEKAKEIILNSEKVIEIRGTIEVWVNGKKDKEIDVF